MGSIIYMFGFEFSVTTGCSPSTQVSVLSLAIPSSCSSIRKLTATFAKPGRENATNAPASVSFGYSPDKSPELADSPDDYLAVTLLRKGQEPVVMNTSSTLRPARRSMALSPRSHSGNNRIASNKRMAGRSRGSVF